MSGINKHNIGTGINDQSYFVILTIYVTDFIQTII